MRLLGQGGMAAVFLGEREGGDFRQLAAVKLLRRGLYSELEQRLFRRERQVLATLAHPNIAHLIDGGLTDAGIPYLIMEFVDGRRSPHAVGTRARRAAGMDFSVIVCRTVNRAPQLIVHRDIKPSNILVTQDGDGQAARLRHRQADRGRSEARRPGACSRPSMPRPSSTPAAR